jgi:hypothetical protein
MNTSTAITATIPPVLVSSSLLLSNAANVLARTTRATILQSNIQSMKQYYLYSTIATHITAVPLSSSVFLPTISIKYTATIVTKKLTTARNPRKQGSGQ